MNKFRCIHWLIKKEIGINFYNDDLLHLPFNSLPNDKVFDWFKLKAFAIVKMNVNEKLKFVFGRVENIVGKGEKEKMLVTSIFRSPEQEVLRVR